MTQAHRFFHTAGARAILSLVPVLFLVMACSPFRPARIGDSLSGAILEQDAPAIVKAGAPAYMILLDSMIAQNPDDAELHASGTKLYALYANAFAENEEQKRLLADKAEHYGLTALSLRLGKRSSPDAPLDDFTQDLSTLDRDDLPLLYAYVLGQLVWLDAHKTDLAALTRLPNIQVALDRMLALDERYASGAAHVWSGILLMLRPPSLGGKPELAKEHFDRALHISSGRDLGAKLAYAKSYAIGTYDKPLFDRLISEILEANPHEPGLTLLNVLAQKQAKELAASAANIF